jgi:hypothetical protein
MATETRTGAMRSITTCYIDREFVESHGHEVIDIISPTSWRRSSPRQSRADPFL